MFAFFLVADTATPTSATSAPINAECLETSLPVIVANGFVLPRTSLKAPVCSMAIFVRCLADLSALLTRNNSRQGFVCAHKGYVWLFAARYPHSFH